MLREEDVAPLAGSWHDELKDRVNLHTWPQTWQGGSFHAGQAELPKGGRISQASLQPPEGLQ